MLFHGPILCVFIGWGAHVLPNFRSSINRLQNKRTCIKFAIPFLIRKYKIIQNQKKNKKKIWRKKNENQTIVKAPFHVYSYEIVYAWIVNSTRNNNWILDERNVLEENRLLQVIRNPGRARFNEVTRGYNADP